MAAECVSAFGLDVNIRVEIRAYGAADPVTRVPTLTGTTPITVKAVRSRASEDFEQSGQAFERWTYDVRASDYGAGELPRGGDHLYENYGLAGQKLYFVRGAERLVGGAIVRITVGQQRTAKK